MSDKNTISAPEAQHKSTGYTDLAALHRDILIILASAGQRGDPRNGAHFDEVTEELQKLYDDSRIAPESVEDELLSIDERYDYIECVGTGAFRVTIDGLEYIEGYLQRMGRYWEETNPWDDGSKLTIERKQVGKDYTEVVDEHLEEIRDE